MPRYRRKTSEAKVGLAPRLELVQIINRQPSLSSRGFTAFGDFVFRRREYSYTYVARVRFFHAFFWSLTR